MFLDETRADHQDARSARPAVAGPVRDRAGFLATPEDLSSPGLSEVSPRRWPLRLGFDGQLPLRPHSAVQYLRRTAASGRKVARELPEAAGQAGGHLRAESRIAAGQALVIFLTRMCFSHIDDINHHRE